MHPRAGSRRVRSRIRTSVALAVAVATAAAGVAVAAPGGGADSAPRATDAATAGAMALSSAKARNTPGPETTEPLETSVRLAQANINKDMGVRKFRADVAAVMSQQPDIIAYNEVHGRADADLVPAGWAMYRTPGPRTGWAPVAWDTSAWTSVDQGTVQISKRPARLSGMVGVRFANWVQLVNPEGQTVSVISTHIAPNNKDTAELLKPSLRVLASLSAELSARGPVLLAGDFNMGLRSSRYDSAILGAVGMRHTFEILGSSFVTHRGGGTIDYVFVGPGDQVAVDHHFGVPMNSDHRAVVADLRLTTTSPPAEEPAPAPPVVTGPTFEPTRVVVKAGATKKERRQVRRMQLKAIRATEPGEAIHLATAAIQGRPVYRALTKAHERGVHVTVLLGRKKLTTQDRELRALLGTRTKQMSWFRKVPRAWRSDRVVGSQVVKRQKPTTLLISRAGATPAYSLVSNRAMDKKPLRPSFRRRTTARVSVDISTYDALYRQYLAQVGRSY